METSELVAFSMGSARLNVIQFTGAQNLPSKAEGDWKHQFIK